MPAERKSSQEKGAAAARGSIGAGAPVSGRGTEPRTPSRRAIVNSCARMRLRRIESFDDTRYRVPASCRSPFTISRPR